VPVTAAQVKELRDKTGAGIMDSKRALEEADGDLARAELLLNEKGLASAAKKAGRSTSEGLVVSYIHTGGRVGSLVELNCETDFVARTEEFKGLAHNLAMQVAAMAPEYVEENELPADETRKPEEVCLLNQAFIRDPSKTINDLVMDVRARVGENVRISRFTRFGLGE